MEIIAETSSYQICIWCIFIICVALCKNRFRLFIHLQRVLLVSPMSTDVCILFNLHTCNVRFYNSNQVASRYLTTTLSGSGGPIAWIAWKYSICVWVHYRQTAAYHVEKTKWALYPATRPSAWFPGILPGLFFIHAKHADVHLPSLRLSQTFHNLLDFLLFPFSPFICTLI